METKTKFTAAEALRTLKNVSKKRLYEMMNDGSLSYENQEYGKKKRRILDGSELSRVFGSDFQPDKLLEEKTETFETVSETAKKPIETQETTFENKLLKQEIQFLREKIQDRERLLSEAKEREKDLSQKLDNAVQERIHLLEDQREKEQKLQDALESSQRHVERPKKILGIFPRKTS